MLGYSSPKLVDPKYWTPNSELVIDSTLAIDETQIGSRIRVSSRLFSSKTHWPSHGKFGRYSEPGTRNSCQAEIAPMVRDDDDVTPELRRRRGESVGSHTVNKRKIVTRGHSAKLVKVRSNREAMQHFFHGGLLNAGITWWTHRA